MERSDRRLEAERDRRATPTLPRRATVPTLRVLERDARRRRRARASQFIAAELVAIAEIARARSRVAEIRQPRVLPRDQREAFASRRARPVRLRTIAEHAELVDRGRV